jgi:THO complex subunit 3
MSIATDGSNLCVCWSPDGQYISICNKDNVTFIVNARDGKILKRDKARYELNEVKWDPTGRMLFVTTSTGDVYVYNWNINGALDVARQAGDNDAAMLSPAQAALPSFLYSDKSSDSLLRTLSAHMAVSSILAFSKNGKYLAMTAFDGSVSLWALPPFADDFICLRNFYCTLPNAIEVDLHGLCFSPDSELLAIAYEDTIEIYFVETGEVMARMACKSVNMLQWHLGYPQRSVALAYSDMSSSAWFVGSLE